MFNQRQHILKHSAASFFRFIIWLRIDRRRNHYWTERFSMMKGKWFVVWQNRFLHRDFLRKDLFAGFWLKVESIKKFVENIEVRTKKKMRDSFRSSCLSPPEESSFEVERRFINFSFVYSCQSMALLFQCKNVEKMERFNLRLFDRAKSHVYRPDVVGTYRKGSSHSFIESINNQQSNKTSEEITIWTAIVATFFCFLVLLSISISCWYLLLFLM